MRSLPSPLRAVLREVLPLGAMLLAATIDYVTPLQFAVSTFYLCVLVPVALRRPWQVAVSYGILASVVFTAVDVVTAPEFAHTIYPYWRGFSQLITFSLVTFTIPQLVRERQRLVGSERTLIRQREELEEVNAKLVTTLEELSATREHVIEDLVRQQQVAVEELTRIVKPVLAAARRTLETTNRAPVARDAAGRHPVPFDD